MTTNDEQAYIKACLQAIEHKLQWGSSAQWSNYDFEKLSRLIATETEVQLSVSTLKRVWGKVSYQHAPSPTTLNALASYLGHADWRAFQQQYRPTALENTGTSALPVPEAVTVNTTQPIAPPAAPSRLKSKWLAAAVIIIVLTLIGFLAAKRSGPPDTSKFSFSANKVRTEGVPNSVIFSYDASGANTDSIYIAQTWDLRRKTLVPRDKKTHSAIYYYPGFFNTKLIVDGHVVKTHDLLIASGGWLGLVEQEPVPLYFRKEDYLKAQQVEIDTNTLKTYQLPLHPKPPAIRFFHEQDMGNLANDNFIFETTLKNDFTSGAGACQSVQVLIQCKDDIIIIPLSAKACIGEMALVAAGAAFQSKDTDLSGFGADLREWTTLRVESRNKEMRFLVNGRLAYQLTFPNNPTGIIGVQYRFKGTGAIKNTWFKNATKEWKLL